MTLSGGKVYHFICQHAHAYAHTHIRILTYAHTNTHIRIRTYTYTHTNTHIRIRTHEQQTRHYCRASCSLTETETFPKPLSKPEIHCSNATLTYHRDTDTTQWPWHTHSHRQNGPRASGSTWKTGCCRGRVQ